MQVRPKGHLAFAVLITLFLVAGVLPAAPAAALGSPGAIALALAPPEADTLVLHNRTELAAGFGDVVTSLGDSYKNQLTLPGTVPIIGDHLGEVSLLSGASFERVGTDVRFTVEDALFDASVTGADPIEVARAAFYISLGPGRSGLGELAPNVRSILEPLDYHYGDGIGILADRTGDGTISLADVGIISTIVDGEHEVEFAINLAETKSLSVPFDLGLNFDLGDIPLDLGPLPNVAGNGAAIDAKLAAKVEAGWTAQLKFGVSEADGFYMPTSVLPVFSAGVFGTAPDLDLKTTLGMFAVRVTDGTRQSGVTEHSRIQIDIRQHLDVAVGATTPERMVAALVKVDTSLLQSAQLRLHVEPDVNLSGTVIDGAVIEFPEITFDIEAEAHKHDDGKWRPTSVRFDDITLNVRDVIEDVGHTFGTFAKHAVGPIGQIGDSLDTPIPGISDVLTTRVTLNSMLPSQGRAFFDEIEKVGDIQTLFNQAAAVAPQTFNFGCVDVVRKPPGTKFGPCIGKGYNLEYSSVINRGITQVHLLELPVIIAMLTSSKPVDMASVGLPGVDIDGTGNFGISESYFNFGVAGNLDVNANLRLVYDSTGLQKAMAIARAGGTPDPRVMIDGIYVKNNAAGPEVGIGVSFSGSQGLRRTALGVEVFSAGASIQASGSLGFEVIDPNRNGKLEYREIAAISNNFSSPQNLTCLYDIESKTGGGLSAWVRIAGAGGSLNLGFPSAGITLKDLTGNTGACAAIIDNATRGIQKFATPVRINGENWLRLNVGAYSGARQFGNTDDSMGATVSARNVGDDIVVDFRTATQTFTGPFKGVLAHGGEGPDSITLSGLSVSTSVDGGHGDDNIIGGPMNNSIAGGDGFDTITGGAGDDVLTGGAGDDTLTGLSGDDTIEGGDGVDTLNGGAGMDILRGNDGDDTLNGAAGVDELFGGAGTDELSGGPANDKLFGEAGNDTITGDNGDDELVGGPGNDSLTDILGSDTFEGGSGNDTIAAGPGDDVISGGAGNDVINSGSGADLASGGEGNDTITGGTGIDLLRGGTGADTLIGGDGNDELDGDSGDDTLNGNAGEDTLRGGVGNDTINGGADSDNIDGRQGNDIITGGDGDDEIAGGVGNDNISGDAGKDTIIGSDGDDTISGGDGNDVLSGDAGDDVIDGGSDDDFIEGHEGDDTLHGDDGADLVNGHSGTNIVHGGEGDDLLRTEDGDDTIFGEAGIDTIEAGNGVNTIYGGDGADRITTGADNDTIDGGSGNDIIDSGDGDDTISGGPNDDTIDSADGNDTVAGDSGDDIITGGLGDDTLNGGFGKDTLRANAGTDVVEGDPDDLWLDAGDQATDRLVLNALGLATSRLWVEDGVINTDTNTIIYQGAPKLEVRLNSDDTNNAIYNASLPVEVQLFGATITVNQGENPVHVIGSTAVSGDILVVAAPQSASQVTVDAGVVSGLTNLPITYEDIEAVTLNGSSQNDTFTVLEISTDTTINAGRADDLINLELPASITGLLVDGEDGDDRTEIFIAGNPSSVTGLDQIGFTNLEQLRVDNGTNSAPSDWSFADGSIGAGGSALLGSVAGVQQVRFLGGTSTADSLDIAVTSAIAQTVTIGDDTTHIIEGVDVINFDSAVPVRGADSVALIGNVAITAGPETDQLARVTLPGNVADVNSWSSTYDNTGRPDDVAFGSRIDRSDCCENNGATIPFFQGEISPTSPSRINTQYFAPPNVPYRQGVGNLLGGGTRTHPRHAAYTIIGNTLDDTVEVIGTRPDISWIPAGSNSYASDIPQPAGKSVDSVESQGDWIFVGDTDSNEVRAYHYDGTVNLATNGIAADSGISSLARLDWPSVGFATDTGSFGAPATVTGNWSSRTGSRLTRELPNTGLPLSKAFVVVSFAAVAGDLQVLHTPLDGSPEEVIGSHSFAEFTGGQVEIPLTTDKVASHVTLRYTGIATNAPNTFAKTIDISNMSLNFGTDNFNLRQTITGGPGFGANLSHNGSSLAVASTNALGGTVEIFANTTNAANGPVDLTLNNSAPYWTSSAVVASTDNGFGSDIDFDGAQLVVGVPGHNAGAGKVELYEYSPGSLTGLHTFTPPDTGSTAEAFGSSVAVIDGLGVAIGAPNTNSPSDTEGAAYFAAESGSWDAVESISLRSPQEREHCGAAVAMWGGGSEKTSIAVGCPGYDSATNTNIGRAPIYTNQSGSADTIAAAGGLAVVLQPAIDRLTVVDSNGNRVRTAAVPGLAPTNGADLLASGSGRAWVLNGTDLHTVQLTNSAVTSGILPLAGAAIASSSTGSVGYVAFSDGTLRWYDAALTELGSIQTGVADPAVVHVSGGYVFTAGSDQVSIAVLSGDTPSPHAVIRNGVGGARSVRDITSMALIDGYLYLTSASEHSLIVLEDTGSGQFEFRQSLRNLANGVLGLHTPQQVFGYGGDIYVLSVGTTGVNRLLSRFTRIASPPPPIEYDIRIPSGFEALSVSTGPGPDQLALRDVQQPISIDTGAGSDIVAVSFVGNDQSATVSTGADSDELIIRSTGSAHIVGANVGSGDDKATVAATAPLGTTTLSLGLGADTAVVLGDHLDSPLTLNDSAFNPGTPGSEDTLEFWSSLTPPVPPTAGSGSVKHPTHSATSYNNIELFTVLAPPVARLGAVTITEGNGVRFSNAGSNIPSGTGSFEWDIDGDGFVGDHIGRDLALSWADLVAAGIDDDGIYPITVRLSTVGGYDEITAALTVINAAPQVSFTGRSTTVDEGLDPIYLNLSGTDVGDDTIDSIIIDWGDGEIVELPALPNASFGGLSHMYLDDGVPGDRNLTVTLVSVSDEDGTYPLGITVPATILNVAPTLVKLSGPSSVDEGTPYQLDLEGIGPRSYFEDVAIDWGDGTVENVKLFGPTTFTHIYDGPATYEIVAVGISSVITFPGDKTIAVDVAGVDPTITLTGPATANEGTYTLGLTAVDPGDDTISRWEVDWGDGRSSVELGSLASLEHDFDGPATPVISVTAFDEDGSYVETASVSIDNLAPVITSATLPATVAEGESAELIVVADDIDVITYRLEAAGGTVIGENRSGNFTIDAEDDGLTTYTVFAIDDDGLDASTTVSTSITNSAPVVELSAPESVPEGSAIDVGISVTDAGADTATTAVIGWGDGATSTATLDADGTANVTHVYTDAPIGNTTRTLTVSSVTDEDGTFASTTTRSVVVKNVAPFTTLTTPTFAAAGEGFDVAIAAVTDPGNEPLSSVSIQWGDGTSDPMALQADGTRTASHIYADTLDAADLVVEVVDSDGTHIAATKTIDVARTPVADDDAHTLVEDTETVIDVGDGDTDADNDIDTGSVLVTAVAHDGVAYVEDGNIVYTPTPNYFGADSLEYTVCDETALCSTATLDLVITPTPDAPVADPDIITISASGSATVDVLANDFDPDGGTFTLVAVDTGTTGLDAAIAENEVTVDANSNFAFVAAGESVDREITYRVANATGETEGTLTVTITGENDAPTAVADQFTVTKFEAVDLDVLSNDLDPDDGDVLTIATIDASNLPLSINASDDSLRFEPGTTYLDLGEGEEAEIQVTYTIADSSGEESTTTATLTIVGSDGGPIVTATGGNVLALTVGKDSVLRFEPSDYVSSSGGGDITLTGFDTESTEGGNVSEGSIIYEPLAGYVGVDTFTFIVEDELGRSAVITANVTVTAQTTIPILGLTGASSLRYASYGLVLLLLGLAMISIGRHRRKLLRVPR